MTDRKTREQELAGLNQVARELMGADTQEEIVEIGVNTGRDLLGLETNAIHLYDEESRGLVPVAATDAAYDLVPELPTFTGNDSIAWRVFEDR